MVDIAGGDEGRDCGGCYLGAMRFDLRRKEVVSPGVFQVDCGYGLEIRGQFAVHPGANRISTVRLLFVLVHRHDAAGIYGEVRDADFCGHTAVVERRDEDREIVGDHTAGFGGEFVEEIVGVLLVRAEVEEMSSAKLLQRFGAFGNSFEDEGVEAVIGCRIAAGQAFVDEKGQPAFVGQMGGMGKRVIRFGAAIRLAPIKNIGRVLTG